MQNETLLAHLENSIKTFENSPASSRYQEGNLAALRELLEDYCMLEQRNTVPAS